MHPGMMEEAGGILPPASITNAPLDSQWMKMCYRVVAGDANDS